VQDALLACEREFLQEMSLPEEIDETLEEPDQEEETLAAEPEKPTELPDLNVNDVLAEITRILEEPND
jgi:hypothetical protein